MVPESRNSVWNGAVSHCRKPGHLVRNALFALFVLLIHTPAPAMAQSCSEWIGSIPVGDADSSLASASCLSEIEVAEDDVSSALLKQYLLSDGQFLDPTALGPLAERRTGPTALRLRAIEAQYARRPDVDLSYDEIAQFSDQAAESNDDAAQVALDFGLSTLALMKGDMDDMSARAQSALELAQAGEMDRLLPKVINSLAVSATLQGDYKRAIDLYDGAITAAQNIGDDYRVANATANIGNIFSDLGDGEAALKYYDRALQLAENVKVDDPILTAGLLTNIGSIHTIEGRHEKALEIYERATPIVSKASRRDLDGLLHFFQAQSLEALGQTDDAIAMAERSIEESLTYRDPVEAATALNWLAARYLEQGDPEKAAETLQRGRDIVDPGGVGADGLRARNDNIFWTLEYARTVARVLSTLGRREEALTYAIVALDLSEDRFEAEKTKAAANADLLFDLKQRDDELTQARQSTQIAELSLSRSRTFLIAAILVVLLIGLVATVLWRLYRSQRELTRTRETYLAEMHHRIKNNLQVLVSLLSIEARSKRHGESGEVPTNAVNRARTMAMVHDRLYGLEPTTSIEAPAFIDDLLALLRGSIGRDDIELKADIGMMTLEGDTMTPLGLIICEAVTNAYKHAFPDQGGQIAVALKQHEGEISIEICDDGVGLPDPSEPPQGTGGIGVELMDDLATQLGGKLVRERIDGHTCIKVCEIKPTTPVGSATLFSF